MPFMDPDRGSGSSSGGSSQPNNGTTATLEGMGARILGGLLTGMAQIQAGGYNATIARQNAVLADISAGDAIARGHLAAATALLKGASATGRQTTALVAGGVQANTGSALDVLSDTSLMSKLDADRISNDAAREAWGYRTKGQQFRQQAAMDEAQGLSAGGASILGGVIGAATYGHQQHLDLS